jgi:hypothetical protein
LINIHLEKKNNLVMVEIKSKDIDDCGCGKPLKINDSRINKNIKKVIKKRLLK